MRTAVVGGILLGVLVTLWTALVVLTGWYKDPALVWTFWVLVIIEIAVLAWTLKRTAAEGRGYGGQVAVGLVASLVGGVLIFLGSLLVTTVLAPEYFEEVRRMGAELARQAGQSEAEVQRLLEAPTQSPVQGALAGFLGTVGTGLLVSVVLAAFLRERPRATVKVR